jgi:nanoRNase/pAp phosphatase (c-di-AMP/oligoRNAs hydrolase)
MTRPENILVVGDETWPVESLVKSLPPKSHVSVWIQGRGWTLPAKRITKNSKSVCKNWDCLKTKEPSLAIVGLKSAEKTRALVGELLAQKSDLKILQLRNHEEKHSKANLDTRHEVSWRSLLGSGVEQELHLMRVRNRLEELKALISKDDSVAFLLQREPDPDGISSALALRKILGRHATSSPIISFGRISRPENRAMVNLLDIQIKQVKPNELKKYQKIICVDCQPSFFKGIELPKITAVFDHHPRVEEGLKGVPFVDIQTELGSTATMLTQYLRAERLEPSLRLATALLYGIKSDTLTLHREVSFYDVEAYLTLYSLANIGLIKRIEKPELPVAYLRALGKSSTHLKLKNSIAVLPLMKVQKEEWIAQAADFVMQLEGAKWALVAGFLNEELIISGRNSGYIHHCGDLFKKLFDYLGSAGGHRSMARAVISRQRWREVFGLDADKPKELAALLHRMLYKELSTY